MANTTDKKASKSGFIGFFKKLGLGIAKAFKNTYYELKKVTWPSKHDVLVYSVVTLGFMVAMGIIIYLIDFGSSALVKLMIG